MTAVQTFTCPQCNRLTCTCNIMDDQADQFSVSDVRPSIPQGAVTDEVLRRNDSILNSATYHKAESIDWKAMWLAEVMRGDHGFEETYTVAELDRARERIDGWSKTKDSRGNITAEYQS
jgi:hypothetical protein